MDALEQPSTKDLEPRKKDSEQLGELKKTRF